MKTIPLTQGQVALVDDEDVERLSQFKWYALWSPNIGSYYARHQLNPVNGKREMLWMHRFIMGARTGEHIDHRNHDTLDNQKSNLRLVLREENQRNRGKPKHNTSGYKGVTLRARVNRWEASIKIYGRTQYLGNHVTPEDAARAYDAKAIELFGEFALTNAALGLLK
jgi:hypothetical protein